MDEKLKGAADRLEWLRVGYTQRSAKAAKKLAEDARTKLNSACGMTSDPKVAAAYAEWKMRRMVETFFGEAEHEND